jgi:hypothetical protein
MSRAADSFQQNREQDPAQARTHRSKGEPQDTHTDLTPCVISIDPVDEFTEMRAKRDFPFF